MATRMQQRRGTASQWISSNSGDGPILNAGEIGWESDTNKFKIGDGVSYWANLDYFSDVNSTVVPVFGTSISFEGSTANEYETTLQVTDPTADRTITLPNVDGTVITTGNLSDITNIGVFTSTITMEGSSVDDNELTLSAGNPTADRTLTFPDATDTLVGKATTDTLTNKTIDIASNTLTGVAALSGATFTGAVSGTDLTLSGNLTVNGTTTNINSTNLVVEDKNIVLADVTSPTDTTADGGGITLKGATDKTFNWVDATDAWTSSEHINLASGKTLKYNGTDLVAAQSGNSGKYLTTDGTTTSWGTVSGYSAPTLGSTSIASGSTTTTLVGFTKLRSDQFTTLDADGYEVDLEAMQIMGAL